jgi:hypothetical protein
LNGRTLALRVNLKQRIGTKTVGTENFKGIDNKKYDHDAIACREKTEESEDAAQRANHATRLVTEVP